MYVLIFETHMFQKHIPGHMLGKSPLNKQLIFKYLNYPPNLTYEPI